MGFGFVVFRMAVPCAGGVEIAKDGIAEPVNPAEPFEHDFGLQFGLAVGIDGEFPRVFADRNSLRETEDRAGGGENKAHDLVAQTGFEKCERGGGIVAEVERGVLHGLGDFGKGGEVHDGVEGRFGEELVEEGGVGDVADHETSRGRDGRAVAAGEVVENGDLEIVLEEEADGGSTDVASASGDQDVLGHHEVSAYQRVRLFCTQRKGCFQREYEGGKTGRVQPRSISRASHSRKVPESKGLSDASEEPFPWLVEPI